MPISTDYKLRTDRLMFMKGTREMNQPLALDISLEQARALHRVWRALNDGDCPKCHTLQGQIVRERYRFRDNTVDPEAGMACPACCFKIKYAEIAEIQRLFAPHMDECVKIFEEWRKELARPRLTVDPKEEGLRECLRVIRHRPHSSTVGNRDDLMVPSKWVEELDKLRDKYSEFDR